MSTEISASAVVDEHACRALAAYLHVNHGIQIGLTGAYAALSATLAAVPKVSGSKVVPIEPTVVMLDAGCVNRKGPHPHQVYTASEVAEIYADMIAVAPKVSALSTPSDVWTATVGTLVASNGTTYVVCINGPHGTMTPNEYDEQWKAAYDVACWNQFFAGGPEPDILAFGPATANNLATSNGDAS